MTRQPDNPPPSERRGWVRYASGRTGSCRRALSRTDGRWRARVLDLSAGGVQLLVYRRFERGTLIRLQLPELEEGAGRDVMVRVVRVSQAAPPARRAWLIAGAFYEPLAEGELRTLAG